MHTMDNVGAETAKEIEAERCGPFALIYESTAAAYVVSSERRRNESIKNVKSRTIKSASSGALGGLMPSTAERIFFSILSSLSLQ